MKRLLVILPIAVLLILVACGKVPQPEVTPPEPVVPAVIVNVTEVVEKDLCAEVTCTENEECRQGNCFCKSAYKQCGSTCIPGANCCTDKDCGPQESCAQGKCKQTKFCDFNMKYEPVKGTCACVEGTKFCRDQGRCIPVASCCDIADCNPLGGNDRRCHSTAFRLELCLTFNGGMHCKKAIVGERNSFSYLKENADVFVDKLREGSVADVTVTGRTSANFTMLKVSEKVHVGNITIENRGGDAAGGNCESA